ncbi:MAG TPA: discoidin domain-containing protein [Actinoplanes sp.]|nr:discoidin domain-containing protein [Actinoplanes sp.]
MSDNLAADAAFTASSSAPESWGWSLRTINDGVRDKNGWSSWSQTEVDHTEWVEFAFPEARELGRVDLYPRVDVPGGSFPATFTISTWTGSAWETVLTKQNLPNPGITPVRLSFPLKATSKVRIEGTRLRLMQLSWATIRPGRLRAAGWWRVTSSHTAWCSRRSSIGSSSNTGWRCASETKSSTGASRSAAKYGRVAVATATYRLSTGPASAAGSSRTA